MTSIPVPNAHDTSPGSEGFLPRSITDPKGGRKHGDQGDRGPGRKILVLSTVEDAGDELGRYVGPDDTIEVVVPVVRQSFLDWLANDEAAFAHAEEVADETAATLSGHSVRSSAGEADVALAIRDALATFAADEIIVAIRSDEDAGFVESMASKDTPRRNIDGIPVRCIVVAEP